MPELSKRRQRQLKADGYDLAFLSQIQPQGNIDFARNDRYWTSAIPCFISMNIRQKTWIGSGYLI